MAMSSSDVARVPAGRPSGGEFAEHAKAASGVALAAPDEPQLPPGVTEDDEELFSYGQCHVLADELVNRTGWERVVVSDGPDGVVGWVHAGVRTPRGTIVDVRGEHDEMEWLDQWGEFADAYGRDFDDEYDGDSVAVYSATVHGWTDEGGGHPEEPDPEVAMRAEQVAQLLMDHVAQEPSGTT